MRTPTLTPVFERPARFPESGLESAHQLTLSLELTPQLTMSLELKQKAQSVVSSTLRRGLVIDRARGLEPELFPSQARAGSSRSQAYYQLTFLHIPLDLQQQLDHCVALADGW